MAELAALGTALATGAEVGMGTALAAGAQAAGVGTTLAKGFADKQRMDAAADVERRRASEDMASGARAAQQRKRELDLITSKQTALAASSGAGVATPTIYDLIGDTTAAGVEAMGVESARGKNAAAARMSQAKGMEQAGSNALIGAFLSAAAQGVPSKPGSGLAAGMSAGLSGGKPAGGPADPFDFDWLKLG